MKHNINRVFHLGVYLSMFFSTICLTSYAVIGNKLLPDGTLEEPFFLVIFTYFFIFTFIICLIGFLITRKKKNRKQKKY